MLHLNQNLSFTADKIKCRILNLMLCHLLMVSTMARTLNGLSYYIVLYYINIILFNYTCTKEVSQLTVTAPIVDVRKHIVFSYTFLQFRFCCEERRLGWRRVQDDQVCTRPRGLTCLKGVGQDPKRLSRGWSTQGF